MSRMPLAAILCFLQPPVFLTQPMVTVEPPDRSLADSNRDPNRDPNRMRTMPKLLERIRLEQSLHSVLCLFRVLDREADDHANRRLFPRRTMGESSRKMLIQRLQWFPMTWPESPGQIQMPIPMAVHRQNWIQPALVLFWIFQPAEARTLWAVPFRVCFLWAARFWVPVSGQAKLPGRPIVRRRVSFPGFRNLRMCCLQSRSYGSVLSFLFCRCRTQCAVAERVMMTEDRSRQSHLSRTGCSVKPVSANGLNQASRPIPTGIPTNAEQQRHAVNDAAQLPAVTERVIFRCGVYAGKDPGTTATPVIIVPQNIAVLPISGKSSEVPVCRRNRDVAEGFEGACLGFGRRSCRPLDRGCRQMRP